MPSISSSSGPAARRWRQLAAERYDNGLDLIGTPDHVAERMGEAIDEIGGDGFLISTLLQQISRRIINEVCEGLAPALQRRGLVREVYTRPTCAKPSANSERREGIVTGKLLAVSVLVTLALVCSQPAAAADKLILGQ